MQSKSAFHFYLVFCVLFFSFFFEVACAQSGNNYTYRNLESYKTFLERTKDATADRLGEKLRKDYSKVIDDKNTALIKQLKQRGFLFDTVAYPYLSEIFDRILEKNSFDKNRFHFFIDRTAAVNAYSYEDGTVVCDLGLVTVMENESQLAMVFCHELGHYMLNHVNNSIIKQLEKYNSPEFLAYIKQIKKTEYNTKEQLEDLLMKDVFDRRRHSRVQEKAADSLGMILYRNTGYNCTTISEVFDLLDAADNPIAASTIQHFFKQESISIDENLLNPAKRMSFVASPKKEIVDSLKTHPDCAQRKMVMQSYFDKNPKTGVDFLPANAERLSAIKKIAFFDEAKYSKDKDDLGFYFYQMIQNNAIFPSDGYIKSEIFDTLVSMCLYQKSHKLYMVVNSEYIPQSNNDEYNKLLKLLDNLSLKDMTEMTMHYYQNNKSLITASSEAIKNLNKLKNQL